MCNLVCFVHRAAVSFSSSSSNLHIKSVPAFDSFRHSTSLFFFLFVYSSLPHLASLLFSIAFCVSVLCTPQFYPSSTNITLH